MPNMRGARPSPRHKAFGAMPHRAGTVPPQFSRLAPELHYWGNDQYGDCVPTESMAAKAADNVPSTNQEGIDWARANGWLNGASLTEVMDAAADPGIPIAGKTYRDGPYQSVDWTDWAVLTSAIFAGQVKLGVAAGQLEGAVSSKNGWTLLSASKDRNLDHCTAACGYGSLAYCCQALGVPVPDGADPNRNCVIFFTWSTYGILSHEALRAITGEAWLRLPTTIFPGPVPPPVPPGPGPAPVPPTPDPWHWCRRATRVALAAARAAYQEAIR